MKPSSQVEVVITGLGASTPLGGDVATTWTGLCEAESGVTELTQDWAANMPCRMAGQLRVDPRTTLSRADYRHLDRHSQVALVAAREAWADAGSPEVDSQRFAVVIGTGIGGGLTTMSQHDILDRDGSSRVSPYAVPMLMPNAASAVVSADLGARGGAYTPVSACASGAEALAMGLSLIRSGLADVVIAGGSESCIHPLALAGFARMQALSTRTDDPAAASRPFDAERDGFVLAEGAAIMVLERATSATARGARIHAVLAGAGVTSDAFDVTVPRPEGQIDAMRLAIRSGGLEPADVDMVHAHATSTPIGDRVEAATILAAIGRHPAVTATKSMTGHLLGAAGALGAVVAVLGLREGVLPAIRNLTKHDPDVDLDVVCGDQPRRANFTAALSNAFGFGGHNVALAFCRA